MIIDIVKFILAVILSMIGIYLISRLVSYAATKSYFKVKSDFEKERKESENGKEG